MTEAYRPIGPTPTPRVPRQPEAVWRLTRAMRLADVVEQVVTGGLGYRQIPHNQPEDRLSLQEHLGHLQVRLHPDSARSAQISEMLVASMWAKDLINAAGLDVDRDVYFKSLETVVSVMRGFVYRKRDSEALARATGIMVYSRGFRAGIAHGTLKTLLGRGIIDLDEKKLKN